MKARGRLLSAVVVTGLLVGSAAFSSPAQSAGPMAPGARICFGVTGRPGDVAVVNLTPVQAAGSGFGLLVSSDIASPPVASNVNFTPGSVDPNVAFAPIGADGKVCYVNSLQSQVDLVADHLGTIASASFTKANSDGSPKRTVDTRVGLGGSPMAPGARICFGVTGRPGDVAVVNLTPVQAAGSGFGLLVSSDIASPPVASNVNFTPGSVDPNVAFAPIGADGKVCYVNSLQSQVDLVADHLGTIASASFTKANPDGSPKRTVDTRVGLGGSTMAPGARVCFGVTGRQGDVAVVNLTPVQAAGPGFGLLVSSDIANPPVASNVNFTPGSVDPNVAFAPIGADGKVCFVNSLQSQVDLVADHLGTVGSSSFTKANSDGSPKRTVDTRDWRPDVYLNFHGSEALLGNTDAQWPYVRANLDGFWGQWSTSTPDSATQVRNTIELTRKIAGRKLITEYPIANGRTCSTSTNDDYYKLVERQASDIHYDRVAVGLYAGDNPDCWNAVGGISGATAKAQSEGFGTVYAIYQATNLIDAGETNPVFPRVTPGSPGDVAYRNAGGVVIECQMDDCIYPGIDQQFFDVIAETHARGQSFVWFTGYYTGSGIGRSGWLAKIQRTYNALAARGLWKPGDAITVVNYNGAYPVLPERNPDGSPADTVTGVLAWLLEQRPGVR